jgi:hypothetical protein
MRSFNPDQLKAFIEMVGRGSFTIPFFDDFRWMTVGLKSTGYHVARWSFLSNSLPWFHRRLRPALTAGRAFLCL